MRNNKVGLSEQLVKGADGLGNGYALSPGLLHGDAVYAPRIRVDCPAFRPDQRRDCALGPTVHQHRSQLNDMWLTPAERRVIVRKVRGLGVEEENGHWITP